MNTFNIYEPTTGRQAHNVDINSLVDAVRPWFWEVLGQHKVEAAIADLMDDAKREAAGRYLGIRIQRAA